MLKKKKSIVPHAALELMKRNLAAPSSNATGSFALAFALAFQIDEIIQVSGKRFASSNVLNIVFELIIKKG